MIVQSILEEEEEEEEEVKKTTKKGGGGGGGDDSCLYNILIYYLRDRNVISCNCTGYVPSSKTDKIIASSPSHHQSIATVSDDEFYYIPVHKYNFFQVRLMCALDEIHNRLYPHRCKRMLQLIYSKKCEEFEEDEKEEEVEGGEEENLSNMIINRLNKSALDACKEISDIIPNAAHKCREIIKNLRDLQKNVSATLTDEKDLMYDEKKDAYSWNRPLSSSLSLSLYFSYHISHLKVTKKRGGKWVTGNSREFLAALSNDAEMREILTTCHLLEIILRLQPTEYEMNNFALDVNTGQLCFLPPLDFITSIIRDQEIYVTRPCSTILGLWDMYLIDNDKLVIHNDKFNFTAGRRTPLYKLWFRDDEVAVTCMHGNTSPSSCLCFIKAIPKTKWFTESVRMLSSVGIKLNDHITDIGQGLSNYQLINPYRYKHSALLLEWFVMDIIHTINSVINLQLCNYESVTVKKDDDEKIKHMSFCDDRTNKYFLAIPSLPCCCYSSSK